MGPLTGDAVRELLEADALAIKDSGDTHSFGNIIADDFVYPVTMTLPQELAGCEDLELGTKPAMRR